MKKVFIILVFTCVSSFGINLKMDTKLNYNLINSEPEMPQNGYSFPISIVYMPKSFLGIGITYAYNNLRKVEQIVKNI